MVTISKAIALNREGSVKQPSELQFSGYEVKKQPQINVVLLRRLRKRKKLKFQCQANPSEIPQIQICALCTVPMPQTQQYSGYSSEHTIF